MSRTNISVTCIIKGWGDLHHDQRRCECQPLWLGTVVNGPEVEMRRWIEPALVPIWHEQHPAASVQLQFDWSASA